MNPIEEKIEDANRDNVLIQFLGSKNVEELKKRIVDAIAEQVISDLSDYRDFLIDPDDIVETLTTDTINEVQDKVQEKLEKVVLERAMKRLNLKNESDGIEDWKK